MAYVHSRGRRSLRSDIIALAFWVVFFSVLYLLKLSGHPFLILYGASAAMMIGSRVHTALTNPKIGKWAETTAVMAEYVRKGEKVSTGGYGGLRTREVRYAPTVTYKTVDGKSIRATFPVFRKTQQYVAGKSYHIRYNPVRPEEFCFVGREDEITVRCGLCWYFGIILAAGTTFWFLLTVLNML